MGQKLTDRAALEQQAGSGDLLMVVDVNDTQGSPEGTSKQMDFKYVIQTDKISVTSAEFQAMDSTGGAGTFRLLANGPGAGYGFILLSALIETHYTSAESSNKNLYIGYDSSSVIEFIGTIGRFMSGKTADTAYQIKYMASGTAILDGSIENKPLVLYTNGTLNGTYSADVYITYQVVQL
tara:strand:+ start:42 stop:581 length:540 start_codon:yes stop_codon:yes gene_type:complete